jgi:hypothetical protein
VFSHAGARFAEVSFENGLTGLPLLTLTRPIAAKSPKRVRRGQPQETQELAVFARSRIGPPRTQRTQRNGAVAKVGVVLVIVPGLRPQESRGVQSRGARFAEVSFENGLTGLPDFGGTPRPGPRRPRLLENGLTGLPLLTLTLTPTRSIFRYLPKQDQYCYAPKRA